MYKIYFVNKKVEYVCIKYDFYFLSRNKLFKYLYAIKNFSNDNFVISTINIVDAIIEFIVKSNHDIKSKYNFQN